MRDHEYEYWLQAVCPYARRLEAWLSAHLNDVWPPTRGLTAAQLDAAQRTTARQAPLEGKEAP